jgi:Xaa-Pro aminopeptidase
MTEFAERRQKVIAQFSDAKIDGLFVTAAPNVRYLSGFSGSNGALLLTPRQSVLLTDPRYTIRAAAESDCKVQIAKSSLYKAGAELASRLRLANLGFEQARISYSSHQDLTRFAGTAVKLKPVGPVVDKLRMVKSAAEIGRIRASVLTCSKAFERTISRLKPARTTEAELAAELDYQMRRLGAESAAFETIVAAGANAALPHAQPTSQALGTNRLLLIDMGAAQDGYCSDMTRVLHVGRPGQKAKALYRAVREAQEAALNAVQPGVPAAKVDRAARQVMTRHGLGRAFVHSTGHGLGLEIHEPPRLGRTDASLLEAGMVITIEPGGYLEGFGGVRIEDTVLVTENGCEILTPTAKELLVV